MKISNLLISVIIMGLITTFALAAEAAPSSENLNTSKEIASQTSNKAPLEKENIKVLEARAKPSMAGSNNSAAYISLHNANKGDLVIVGAMAMDSPEAGAASVANRVEMHMTVTDEKGVTKMVAVNRLIVPAEGELKMAPGGIHIMLLDLKQTLKEDDKIFVNLIIQDVGQYLVEVPVKK
ncbi:MAG UNVERIFIED_CONTAM: copper chaperone PCu(A)C [Rickettsiaceae bacterium]|jgi:copper(I)-binding protein